MPLFLLDSSLHRKVGDRLVAPFDAMTTFFFRRSVEKAFQMDEPPSDLTLDPRKPASTNPPHISSAVDDVMYIVNQMIERSLSTSQRAVISTVIPMIARVLSSDFIGMVQRKMRDESYPKAAAHGALPPEQTTVAFLVLLNNLDVASDYIKRIVQGRVEINHNSRLPDAHLPNAKGPACSSLLLKMFPLEQDALFVSSTLKSLQSSFDGKASELVGYGIFVVFKNIMKPRLRPMLAEAFRDIDYQTKQEGPGAVKVTVDTAGRNGDRFDAAVQDRFQRGWHLLTQPVNKLLTERNFEKLVVLMLSYLGEVLEKRIWSHYGRLDSLGALKLERDIGSIVSILIRGGKYHLRDSFTRCTQICLVMNMEDDEWESLERELIRNANDGIEWRLEPEERVRARAMIHNRTLPIVERV